MTPRWAALGSGLAGLLCLSGLSLPVRAQADNPGFSPQHMLDVLARPLPAGSRMGLPPEFPPHYGDWSPAQQQQGKQILLQRCGLFYALTGDNPNAHLLPQTMSKQEAAELALDVCLSAKMPEDWPERQQRIADAERLIAKANTKGATLQLPAGLRAAK